MDPADPAAGPNLREIVSRQGILLGRHEQELTALRNENQHLLVQLTECSRHMSDAYSHSPHAASAPPPLQSPPEPRLAHPEPYDGTLGRCRGFLLQCTHIFALKPQSFGSDTTKVCFIIGLLRGRALAWAEAEDARRSWTTRSFEDFVVAFKAVFDLPDHLGNVSQRLLSLTQGSSSVADYSIEFRILAAETGWDEGALRSIFFRGLNEHLKDELSSRDDPDSLDALISLTIRLDNRIRERRRERQVLRPSHSRLPSFAPRRPRLSTSPPALEPNPSSEGPEPMQLGRTRLTPEERERRLREGKCLYCGNPGHILSRCPIRPKDRAHQ